MNKNNFFYVFIVFIGFFIFDFFNIPAFYFIPIAFLIIFLGAYYEYVHLFFKEKDMNKIHSYVNSKKEKNPQIKASILHLEGKFDELERFVLPFKDDLRKSQIYYSGMFNVFFNRDDFPKAKEMATMIKHNEGKLLNFGYLAIAEKNFKEYEKIKAEIKFDWMKDVLTAEYFFKICDFENADKFGDSAIDKINGLQKYILIKGKEHQEKQTNRKSYF